MMKALDVVAHAIVWTGILLVLWIVMGMLFGVAIAAAHWVVGALT